MSADQNNSLDAWQILWTPKHQWPVTLVCKWVTSMMLLIAGCVTRNLRQPSWEMTTAILTRLEMAGRSTGAHSLSQSAGPGQSVCGAICNMYPKICSPVAANIRW